MCIPWSHTIIHTTGTPCHKKTVLTYTLHLPYNPRAPVAISIAYLLMIPIGNRLMEPREPFKLKYFSIAHNGFLFALSLYMVIETIRGVWVWTASCV